MRHPLRVLVFLFGLLPSGCVTATASVPEVEVTRQNLTFPGVPTDLPTEVPEDMPPEIRAQLGLPLPGEAYHFPTQSFTYERVPADIPSGMSSDLHIREVTIRSHEGSVDLSFIRGLLLTVSKPTDPSFVPEVLLQYPAPGELPADIMWSITLPYQGSYDAIDPWRADASVYTLDVWGDLSQLPRQAWSVDVVLILSGSIRYEY